MAKKISQLPPADAFDGTELGEVVQAGVSKQARTGAHLPPGYIDGLAMQWVSGTALTVSTGTAYIPSLGYAARVNTAIAKTGLSLTANTWYHVYLFVNGSGVPDIEIVTTAPAAPYNGTARTKTGDTSRRYLGSVRTGTGGAIFQFIQNGDTIHYTMDVAISPAITRVLTGGVATSVASVAANTCIPGTARLMLCNIALFDATASVRLGNSEMAGGSGLSSTAALLNVSGGSNREYVFTMIPTDSNQAIQYFLAGTVSGTGVYIDVTGYTYTR